MLGYSTKRVERVRDESREVIVSDRDAALAQAQCYRTTLDAIALGVCRFDGEGRLTLGNRRFGEIYRLTPEQVRPGATRQEIAEHRAAVGTSATSGDADPAAGLPIDATAASKTWTEELKDGRLIKVSRQSTPEGDWVETHEDVTGRGSERFLADERMALQLLIDQVPDYLWIKDAESRFVVVNKALATDCGLAKTSDLVGLSDFDIHPPEAARAFRAHEMEIIASGRSAVDIEDTVVSASGARKCLSSTKAPLRDENGEVFGLMGIARDVTARVRADELRDGQAQILEMIAKGAPLRAVLEHLVHTVESHLTGIFGSIMLLDEDGIHLRLRRCAESGGGVCESDRRHLDRPQRRIVRDSRLPAKSSRRHRYRARSPVGRSSRLGRPIRLSVVLVDPDPVESS